MDITTKDRKLLRNQLIDRRKIIETAEHSALFPTVSKAMLGGKTIKKLIKKNYKVKENLDGHIVPVE